MVAMVMVVMKVMSIVVFICRVMGFVMMPLVVRTAASAFCVCHNS